MINLSQSKKHDLRIVLFAIVFVQLILAFQGFDVCDDGFVLTFYQQIYNDPSSVEYSFVYWLSGVVGGFWYEFYPKGGILWFKILTIIIHTITFIVGYNIFKEFIPKRVALLGLFIVLFVNDFGFLIYYHNHLTALLAILSVLFLLKGLIKNNSYAIIFSGCIIGVNVFTRIPNLTLFVFILAIPFYVFLNNKPIKKAIKPMLYYVLGIITGFVFIALLLVLLGQFNIMQHAISGLFDLGATKDSSHNVSGLFMTYYYNYKNLFGVIVELSLITISFFAIYTQFNTKIWLRNSLLFLIFCYVFLWFKEGDIYTVYAIAYLGSFFVLFAKQNPEIKTLAFLGVLMLTFLPLGSGGAIVSSGYMCIWLSVPFFFHFFVNLKETTLQWNNRISNQKIQFSEKSFFIFITFIFIAFSSAKTLNVSRQAYFDKGSRLKKTHAIESPLARGIYTTERRAKIINDLLINLKDYVSPNDYLLAYDKIPMVHFLTQTRPYMYNSWVWIYDSYSFEKKLKKAKKEIKIYPVIVTQKFETTRSFSEPIPDYLSENLTNPKGFINAYNTKKNKTMNSFLSENNYKIVWSNAYFNIFKTKKTYK